MHSSKWKNFKAYELRWEIFKKLHKNSILLLILPTGVGKTVIMPKLLLHYFGYNKKVIVTTPRHGTTKLAGEYSAKCLDVPLYEVNDNGADIQNPAPLKKDDTRYLTSNKIVGYKHGGTGNKYSDKDTILLFTTD